MFTTLQVSISFHEVLGLMPNFAKFMKTFLKGIKQKLVKEHVNITKKDDTTMPPTLPPKLKDPSKFTIPCTIGGVKIPRALGDLGSSINVVTLNKVKELNLEEIIPSNMTLTLDDLFVTHPFGILQDVLVHVDDLIFPVGRHILYSYSRTPILGNWECFNRCGNW